MLESSTAATTKTTPSTGLQRLLKNCLPLSTTQTQNTCPLGYRSVSLSHSGTGRYWGVPSLPFFHSPFFISYRRYHRRGGGESVLLVCVSL